MIYQFNSKLNLINNHKCLIMLKSYLFKMIMKRYLPNGTKIFKYKQSSLTLKCKSEIRFKNGVS